MKNEEWRDVPGYEGWYLISDSGRVMRVRSGNRTRPGHILSTHQANRRYSRVKLTRNGIRKEYLVHRLVAAAFIGPCPEGYEVNHKNGDSHDNRVFNLEYATRQENALHSVNELNRWPDNQGEKHGMAKVNADQVREIRRLSSVGVSSSEIAKRFGISQHNVGNICARRSWKHI